MKSKIVLLILTSITVGCGTSETSDLKQGTVPQLPYIYHTAPAVVSDTATLYGFPGPDGQSTHQTTAILQVALQCGQRVHSFHHNHREQGAKVVVNYHAVIETDTTAGVCETDPKPFETGLHVDGARSEGDFDMKNVAGSQKTDRLRQGETSLYSATEAKVIGARKICPTPTKPGEVACKALGSYITVELSRFGCRDRTAFTNWRISRADSHNKVVVDLAAFGVNHIHNQRSRCGLDHQKRTIRIMTLYDVTSASDVQLNLLRKS